MPEVSSPSEDGDTAELISGLGLRGPQDSALCHHDNWMHVLATWHFIELFTLSVMRAQDESPCPGWPWVPGLCTLPTASPHLPSWTCACKSPEVIEPEVVASAGLEGRFKGCALLPHLIPC